MGKLTQRGRMIHLLVFILIGRLDNTQMPRNGFHVTNDLLLYQVEAHSKQGDPEQQVQRTQGDAQLCRFLQRLGVGNGGGVDDVLGGNEIPETDRREGDEAEVGGVGKPPRLPVGEEVGACNERRRIISFEFR